MGLTDQLYILTAAKKGDREAFISLIEPLESKLYQTALGIVGNRQDAEDIWQSTVLKALRSIGSLRQPVFKTWITRILLNEAKQHLRKKYYTPIPLQQLPEDGVRDEDIATKLLVQNCMQKLSLEHRQAVILRFWLDLTLEQMAEAMHVPLSTAKTRLYQGIGNLKNHLGEVDIG